MGSGKDQELIRTFWDWLLLWPPKLGINKAGVSKKSLDWEYKHANHQHIDGIRTCLFICGENIKHQYFKASCKMSQQSKLRRHSQQRLKKYRRVLIALRTKGRNYSGRRKCSTFIMQCQIGYWNHLFTFSPHYAKGGKKTQNDSHKRNTNRITVQERMLNYTYIYTIF